MNLQTLIALLQAIEEKEGGLIPVVWESISHSWPPDPTVRDRGDRKVVVLNP